MYQVIGLNYESITMLIADIQKLIDTGATASNVASIRVQDRRISTTLFVATYGGTYLSVVSYLIYSYSRARRHESA